MGASQSTPENTYLGGLVQGASVVGGADVDVVSYVKDYEQSADSKGKHKLIDAATRALADALQQKAPQTSSAEEKVTWMLKAMPNFRKDKKSLSSDSSKQLGVLRRMATAINKGAGSPLINESGSEMEILSQVQDLIGSLSGGLGKEHTALSVSIKRTLDNMQVILKGIEQAHTRTIQEIKAGDDDALKAKVDAIEDVYRLLINELKLFINILSNLTNVNLKSVDAEIVELLRDNKDFEGLVKSVKGNLGTAHWGDALAYWLSGVRGTAQLAAAVQKYLKTIGMSVADYKKQSKIQDLILRTQELMEKLPADKLHSKKILTDFETAVEELRKVHGQHDQIVKALGGGAFGGEVNVGGSYIPGAVGDIDPISSAAGLGPLGTDPSHYGGAVTNLKKKLKVQSKTRDIMMKDFKQKSKIIMDRLYHAIYEAGQAIGTGSIKLTDELQRFKQMLDEFSLSFREGIEYALTGMYRSASAVEQRSRFIGVLKALAMTLEPLKGQSSKFADISSQIDAFIRLVDFFNDKLGVYNGVGVAPDRGAPAEKLVIGSGTYELAQNNYTLLNAGSWNGVVGGSHVLQPDYDAIAKGGSLVLQPDYEDIAHGGSLVLQPDYEGIAHGGSMALQPDYDAIAHGGAQALQPDYGKIAHGGDVSQLFGGDGVTASKSSPKHSGGYDYSVIGVPFGGAEDDLKEMLGGADGGAEFRAAVTLRNARNTFNHFYNVAKFRANLKIAAEEMKTYNKDYETMMGTAIALEVDNIREWANKIRQEIGTTSTSSLGFADAYKAVQNANDNKAHSDPALVERGEYAKEEVLELVKTIEDARTGLYRVAQAIDLLLQKFTDAVALNPDDIAEVSKLLSSVDLMANWFNEKTGDSIAGLYEHFPWTMRGFRVYFNKKLQTDTFGGTDVPPQTRFSNMHYYDIIGPQIAAAGADSTDALADLSKPGNPALPGNPFLPISPKLANQAHKYAKYVVDKFHALKNIVSAFSYLGNKFGGKNVAADSFMSPAQIHQALTDYLYVSALVIGWNTSVKSVVRYGMDLDGVNLDYVHSQGFLGGDIPISSSVNNDHLRGVRVTVPDNMGPTPNGLLATGGGVFRIAPYLSASWSLLQEGQAGGIHASDANYSGAWAAAVGANLLKAIAADNARNGILDGATEWKAVEDIAPGGGALPFAGHGMRSAAAMRIHLSVAMAGIPPPSDRHETSSARSISGWNNLFDRDDKVFINLIKAMAAKVFTVTGLYNMLHFDNKQKYYALNPTRLILGGADGGARRRGKHARGGDSSSFSLPKIYPEIVELYARLPLLAEFYREVFTPRDDVENSQQLVISMVPEVGATWTNFIQIIFEQPATAAGIYTDNTMRRLIHEINEIYLAKKGSSGKDVVLAIIRDFVAEINARYGLLKTSERKSYYDENYDRLNNEVKLDLGQEYDEDYDILNEDVVASGIAPSDRFSRMGSVKVAVDRENEIKVEMYEALRMFRKRIETRVRDVLFVGNPSDSDLRQGIPEFGSAILSTRNALANTAGAEEQFKMVCNLMLNIDTRSVLNKDAALMFHETIVMPLATLTAVAQSLMRYRNTCRDWNAYPLWSALVTSFNARNSSDRKPGPAWRVWQGTALRPAFAINDTYDTAYTAHNVVQAVAVNAGHEIARLDADRVMGDLSAEGKRCLDAARATTEGITSETLLAISKNLYRRTDHTFPGGFMGGAEMTFEDYLSQVDLYLPRHVSRNNAAYTRANHWNGGAGGPAQPFIDEVKKALDRADGDGVDPEFGMHRHVAYVAIRWEALFKRMLKLLYGLQDLGGMCEVTVQNGKVTVNHVKLQQYCEEVFAEIRKSYDKFRGVFPVSVLAKYENHEQKGSINWLQAKMFDQLFGDRNRKGLSRAHLAVTRNFQLITNQHPEHPEWKCTYYSLTAPAFVAGVGGGSPTPAPYSGRSPANDMRKVGWCVESVLAEMVHYYSPTMSAARISATEPMDADVVAHGWRGGAEVPSAQEPLSNFANSRSLVPVWTCYDPLSHLMKDALTRQVQGFAGDRMYRDNKYKGRYDFYLQNGTGSRKDRGFRGDANGDDEKNANTRLPYGAGAAPLMEATATKVDIGAGLLIKLNEVIAAYMRQFWDVAASKIYAPLIEAPANGVFNQAVFGASGFPDLAMITISKGRDDLAKPLTWTMS